MGHIYIIKNDINDKVYIGQTSRNIKERFHEHIYDAYTFEHNTKLNDAITSLGYEHFRVELVCECDSRELNKLEVYYIKEYNSYYNGYNSTTGGGGKRAIEHDHIADSINNMVKLGYNKDEISITLNIAKNYISKYANFDNRHSTEKDARTKPIDAFIINEDGEIIIKYSFNSVNDAFLKFSELGLCADNKGNFYSYVKNSCIRHNIAFGYRWKRHEENVDISKIKGVKLREIKIKEIYKCKYCGKETDRYNRICNVCQQCISKGKTIKPSDEQLLYLIYTGKSLRDIARLYDRTTSTVAYWKRQLRDKGYNV